MQLVPENQLKGVSTGRQLDHGLCLTTAKMHVVFIRRERRIQRWE